VVSTAATTAPWPSSPALDDLGSTSRPSESTGEVERICQWVDELDGLERARLLRALSVPVPDRSVMGRSLLSSRRRIVCLLALCCLGLIPWTIGLAVTLPRSYLVASWPLAWTGFDIILLGCLGSTAWALWKQRQVAVAASMVTSALLLCDAWFDIVTAHSGRCLILSVITAVFAEIPIAILLGVISVRLMHASVRAAPSIGLSSGSLWRTPLGMTIGSGLRPDGLSSSTGPAAGNWGGPRAPFGPSPH
jgi:hypothetical protein